MAYDDLFPTDDAGYSRAHDALDAAHASDVSRRAADAGVDPDEFATIEDCDLYLQSIGR